MGTYVPVYQAHICPQTHSTMQTWPGPLDGSGGEGSHWLLRTDCQPFPPYLEKILLKAGNALFCIVAPAVASVLSGLLGVGGKLFTWPSGVGWAGFLDRARQVRVRGNRSRLRSRLRVKPGLPGQGLWSLSIANRASWSQTLA